MAYLAWRVLTGRHRQITINFQVPGHTRCLVDAGFAKSNTALRMTHGLEWYNWKQYFKTKFKPIHGIMKSQSFRFTATNPGDVFIKENIDSAERCLHILQVSPDVFETSFPEVLTPGGLSRARQEYLFKRIRPFVREGFKDELCPSVEE